MIRALATNLQARIRSGVAVTSFTQCVEELVLNSLDAGATCVAVRLDISVGKIQVVDNGRGISRQDLELIGSRYCTSKCHTLDDLENLVHYGYRGEALASIREVCLILEVESRCHGCIDTFLKLFRKGEAFSLSESLKQRPSQGTTITVHDLFYKLAVRKKALNAVLEFERIRRRLEAIALIHPNISFTLRNDTNSSKVLQTHKTNSVLGAFSLLFGASKARYLKAISNSEANIKLNGYISTHGSSNKHYQFVYINERIVLKTKIHKLVSHLITKSSILKKGKDVTCDHHPIFIINISCALSDYDVTFDPAKTLVEFKDWSSVLKCVENAVKDFFVAEKVVVDARLLDISPEIRKLFQESEETRTADVKKCTREVPYGSTISTVDFATNLQSLTVNRVVNDVRYNGDREEADDVIDIIVDKPKNCADIEKEVNVKSVESDSNVHKMEVNHLKGLQQLREQFNVHNHVSAKPDANPAKPGINHLQGLEELREKFQQRRNNAVLSPKKSNNLNLLKGFSRIRAKLIQSKINREQNEFERNPVPMNTLQNTDTDSHEQKRCSSTSHPIVPTKVAKLSRDQHPQINSNYTALHPRPSSRDRGSPLPPLSPQCSNSVNNSDDEDASNSHNINCLSMFEELRDKLCDQLQHQWTDETEDSGESGKSSNVKFFQTTGSELEKSLEFDAYGAASFIDTSRNQLSGCDTKFNEFIQIKAQPQVASDTHSSQNESFDKLPLNKPTEVTEECNDGNDQLPERWFKSGDPKTGKTFFIDSVTGNTSFHLPSTRAVKAEKPILSVTEDIEPKKRINTISGLSPVSKDNLEVMLSSHGDEVEELGKVKWKDEDGTFIKTMLKSWNNPVFENTGKGVTSVDQISGSCIKVNHFLRTHSFTKDMLNSVQVVNQVDDKFIACLMATSNSDKCIVMIDQHAAHERVRLEQFIEDAYESQIDGTKQIKSMNLETQIQVSLNNDVVCVLKAYPHQLQRIGISCEFRSSNTICITKMPTCVQQRDLNEKKRGKNDFLQNFAQRLLLEQANTLQTTHGANAALPKAILDVLAARACGGAIKFGDRISRGECERLVKGLQTCSLPFQCAHGRPSLIPLFDMKTPLPHETDSRPPSLWKLRQRISQK